MGQNAKVIYDRRSNQDRRTDQEPSFDDNGIVVKENRRMMLGDRRKTEGLELSSADIDDDEFAEVFKQFQKEPEENIENLNQSQSHQNLEIIDYQVLYREGVECAYIALLKTHEQNQEPTLYAFSEESENADSEIEKAPLHVQNIFGPDAYECYLEQGWHDISKTENIFPWALKAWLAQNMKQDTIETRQKF